MIFSKYENELLSIVTNRDGGVSNGNYKSLNMALHVGDDPLAVLKNRTIVASKYGFNIKNLIYAEQIHSANIKVISDSAVNKIENCDSLVTNIKNIPIMIVVADCIAVMFFDPIKKVIAISHAGREGTLKKISQKTILKMKLDFGSNASDILVHFSPSICVECYEVSKEMAYAFENKYVKTKNKKFYIDIAKANIDQLLDVGIKKENIENSKICTKCNDKYFSYRRDGKTGRFAAIMMLR